jgi:GMP synthase-like glutamine amidotransferase
VTDVDRRVLLLQHDVDAGPGLVADWVAERGGTADTVFVPRAPELPDPNRYSLIVSLGSEHCAIADHRWIEQEGQLLLTAHEANIPVLGICFGAQLLARALGAEIRADSACEVGWQQIESDDERISVGPWFQWHFDTFVVPPGARQLAHSSAGAEAFVLDNSVGVQFHPEVTREIVASWGQTYRPELDAKGIPPAVLTVGAPTAPELRGQTFRLLDALVPNIAPVDPAKPSGV